MLGLRNSPGQLPMPNGLIILLVMILGVIIYTIAKVIRLNRLSEQQWEQADKSKIKEWDDDEWE